MRGCASGRGIPQFPVEGLQQSRDRGSNAQSPSGCSDLRNSLTARILSYVRNFSASSASGRPTAPWTTLPRMLSRQFTPSGVLLCASRNKNIAEYRRVSSRYQTWTLNAAYLVYVWDWPFIASIRETGTFQSSAKYACVYQSPI